MFRKKLRYQLGCFCNATSIKISADVLSEIAQKFIPKGFLPITIQEIDQGTMLPVQRLGLQSLESGLQVFCLSGRIDVVKEYGSSGLQDIGDIREFVASAQVILSDVLDEFSIKASRLVLISEFLLPEMTKEEVESVHAFYAPNSFSAGKLDNVEWTVKNIARGVLVGSEELVNYHSAISRASNQIFEGGSFVDYEGLHLMIDINTLGENTETRFVSGNIAAFYDCALIAHDSMLQHYTNRMAGGDNV